MPCLEVDRKQLQVSTHSYYDIKVDQIGPKWDKSWTFSDRFRYILARR